MPVFVKFKHRLRVCKLKSSLNACWVGLSASVLKARNRKLFSWGSERDREQTTSLGCQTPRVGPCSVSPGIALVMALKMYRFLCVLSKTNHDTRQRARPGMTFPLRRDRRQLIYDYAPMSKKDRYRRRKRKVDCVVAMFLMTKSGKQSSQTTGLDSKGWHSR